MKYGVLKDGWVQIVAEGQGLPVVETPPPSPLEYRYKAVARYEEQAGQLVKVWEIQPWTEEERKSMEEQENVE